MKDSYRKYFNNAVQGVENIPNNSRSSVVSSVRQGIQSNDVGSMFMVSSQTQGEPGIMVDTATPRVYDRCCTDGERLYTFFGTKIYAYSCDDFTAAEWEYDTSRTITSICCDGNRVFVGFNTGIGGEKIRSVSRNGSDPIIDPLVGPFSTDVYDIKSNGFILVYTAGNRTNSRYSLDLTNAGSYNCGALVRAVGISHRFIIASGRQDSELGADTTVLNGGLGLMYRLTLGIDSAVVREVVINDGDDFIHLSDGKLLSYIHIGSDEGSAAWSFTNPITPGRLACDGGVIYITSGKGLKAVDKYSSAFLWEIPDAGPPSGCTINDICTDGFRLFSVTSQGISTISLGNTNKRFVRTSGTDRGRAPFHNLAVPCPDISRRRTMWGSSVFVPF